MRNFGMPTLIENKTLEENLALCRELGLGFVELNMNFPEYQLEQMEETAAFCRKADAAGVYYTIHLDENLNIADFNPLVRQACLETVRRSIEAAKAFVSLKNRHGDASQPMIVNMHMHHGIYITLPDRKVYMYERDFNAYMACIHHFRACCRQWIGKADVKICIENTDGFRPYEMAAIRALLEEDCFMLTWDIGHSKATGEKDMPFLLANRERLGHFHIHDGMENPPKNHLALGDGEINLADRLQLARELNARCVLETKTIAALKKSTAWLKNVR